MKKIFLGTTLIFLLTFNVNAETILADDLEKGKVYSSDNILDVVPVNYGTATEEMIHVVYLDKEGKLLEAFTASNGGEFTFFADQEIYNYPYDMFLWEDVEFNFGYTCSETYKQFSEEHIEWCDKYLNMYSSGKDISNIKHWQVESTGETTLSEFCDNTPEVQKSFTCRGDVNYYKDFDLIILKEYAPAEFKLECSPKEVKKGETSNCQLRIKSSDSINKITINTNLNNNELFSINDIKGIEGWEIIENKDGIITLTTENEFQTEGVILSTTIQFKEDVVDTVDIELNNIDYTTTTGYELKSSTKENIKVYEEIKNPETKNPFTGILCLLGIIILTNIFMYYKSRKTQGSETI